MPELTTNVEKYADQARDLPEFKEFSLPGVKERVANILKLIGRVDGIFSTYSAHDISHVDAMVEMLDWIVPPSTKEVMTPVDWLLTVLGIYLHDLGMVVTKEEYNNRMDMPAFTDFLENIEKDPEGKEYLSRIENMSDEEKDQFFFQEYIRVTHPIRIREWIGGTHSTHWGEGVEVIAMEIKDCLNSLPSRFRKHLGTICESHHKDNLDDRSTYPLCQYYGNNREVANVQYAALLLRTVDLLHVTKDRTPSIMYKSLHLSDPKSVQEWKRQMGTFSVHMERGGEFDSEDTDSHNIVVSADFSEEKSFFAFTEYLTYADEQIKQSKRWADASQRTNEGKHFFFPWLSIKRDVLVEGNEPIQMNFELDRGRLLDLLVGHTIYNDPVVAVRELLQNSIDAIRYQHYLDKLDSAQRNLPIPQIGEVKIFWDSTDRLLSVEDNGTGMDIDVIKNHLMRVGMSYYDTPIFRTEHDNFSPISRFGIGILTCFMISDEIEIITVKNNEGYRIRMSSVKADYLIKKLELGNPIIRGLESHGTKVRLKIRSDINLSKRTMLDIVKYWIILPACDVRYFESGKTPQKIGFTSINEAVKYFQDEEKDTIGKSANINVNDILSFSHSENGHQYELAIMVRKGFSQEHSIIEWRDKQSPGVCIEGIRADNHIPGFDNTLCGLLSVRGNKKFRTNVSRMNLEKDHEYYSVAELCANLLFKHVETEIERISNQKGEPLSKAASAANWVYTSFSRKVVSSQVKEKLDSQYNNLPIIVIERSDDSDNPRILQSFNEVMNFNSFWTIESRMVDYLGVISRDIGKELSINEFLSALAPEYKNPMMTPLIPDAHRSPFVFTSYHEVEMCEFSKENQQTVIKWKIMKNNPWVELNEILLHPKEINEIIRNRRFIEYWDQLTRIRYGYGGRIFDLNTYRKINITSIIGDIENIIGINTLLITLINSNHPISNYWNTLLETLKAVTSRKDIEKIAILLEACFMFHVRCGNRRWPGMIRNDDKQLNNIWSDTFNDVNSIIDEFKLGEKIPDNPSDIFGKAENWFDARSYWHDWFK